MKQTSSQQRQHYKRRPAAGVSGSFAEPTRPFASVTPPSEPSLPHERQERPAYTTQFKHSLDRIPIHPPMPEHSDWSLERTAITRDTPVQRSATNVANEAEHVAPGETTNPSTFQLSADTEALAEQDQSMPTACGTAPLATSSASPLQRRAAADPVPPLPPVNRQVGTKRTGWSIERMAITRDQLPPAQRYATSVPEMPDPAPQTEVIQRVESVTPKENTTGLPDHLKAGIEGLSGLSLDDVHVHYNSAKPAQVDALAYTQGTEIHVGPGQEKHLAHEAWHVVQQKEGRVQPTLQAKGVAINDDVGLEKEADVMGRKASNLTSDQMLPIPPTQKRGITSNGSIQRMIGFEYQLVNSFVTPSENSNPENLNKGDTIGDKRNGIVPTIDIGMAGEYNLEVISDVFDEVSVRGWRNFKNAISATCNMVRRLETATSNEPRPVSEVLAGGIDGYDIEVRNQEGVLHITAGIQLDRLEKFLTDFSNKTNVTLPNPNGPLATTVPDTVDRATTSLNQIQTLQGFPFSGTLKREIFSLVSILATTMQRLWVGTPYFKGLYRLLNRTDMVTQVMHVRTRMDEELTGGGHPVPDPHPLRTVLEASLLDLDQPLVLHKPPTVDNADWAQAQRISMSLTRRQWLQQLFVGNDPLSVAWLKQQEGVAGAQEAADILESVGSFGGHTDPSASSIRPIFEIRTIPRFPSVDNLEEWALGVARFIKAINEGIDQPLVLEGRRGNTITRFLLSAFQTEYTFFM